MTNETASGITIPSLQGIFTPRPRIIVDEKTIRRFEPRYWTVDGPLTASFCIITTGPDSFRAHAILRTKKDIVGVKWESEDKFSHTHLRYLDSRNLAECKFSFRYKIEGIGTIYEGSSGFPNLNDIKGLVLSVKDSADNSYYVRLANYEVEGNGVEGKIVLDFAGGPVYGGHNILDAAQRVSIPWNDVKEVFLGVADPLYDIDATDQDVLPEPRSVTIDIFDIEVTGANSTLKLRDIEIAEHNMRVCDGYDDAYNLTPERVVRDIMKLGYRKWYNIYIGASHLHDLDWDPIDGTLRVSSERHVSLPTRAWFTDIFHRLRENDFQPIISQSYEVFAAFTPYRWRQRASLSSNDPNGPYAATGWMPPSTLLSPANDDAFEYLRRVALWFVNEMIECGLHPIYQVGEPWYWDGSYTNTGPCFYDHASMERYELETGNSVPLPYIQSVTEEIGNRRDYLEWLGHMLGSSIQWLCDEVQAAYPQTTTAILLFTPQILQPRAPMLTIVNFPKDKLEYPRFDILQLEDYDWVTEQHWDLHAGTLPAGRDILGYPLDKTHYFTGFNLNLEDADENWPPILRAGSDGFDFGVAEVHVWARPQVWRDSIIYPHGRVLIEAAIDPEPGPPMPVYTFPEGLRTTKNSWGDVTIHFNMPTAVSQQRFRVQILSSYEAPFGMIREDAIGPFSVAAGIDIPVRYSVERIGEDFGVAPYQITWRVARAGTEQWVGTTGPADIDDSEVLDVIPFIGQSNAFGHFSDLSGEDARHDKVSANTFRTEYAKAEGMEPWQVVPLNCSLGSSAADKRAAEFDAGVQSNYWWDLDTGTPGPRAIEAVAAMLPFRDKIPFIIDAQGEADVGATDPGAAPRFSTPERYRAAKLACYAWIREQLNLPNLQICIQAMGRAYWGVPASQAAQVLGGTYKEYRDVQIDLARSGEGVIIGSFCPGSQTVAGYVQEVGNPGWIHFTPKVFHDTARELAHNCALWNDLSGTPPVWVSIPTPSGFVRQLREDGVSVSWNSEPGDVFVVKNINLSTGAVIDMRTVRATAVGLDWTFTNEAQEAAYGYSGDLAIRLDVYQQVGSNVGPSVVWESQSSTVFTDHPDAPVDMSASRNSWGDITFSFRPQQDDPEDHAYGVQIMDGGHVKRVIMANVDDISGGVLSVEYTAEMSAPDFGFAPTYLQWRVFVDEPEVAAQSMASITLDNSHVQKVAVIGINSLGGGYFNDLSDSINPGGTGAPGRKDVVAAATFRQSLAANLGLKRSEVIPVMTVVGSSPINPMPYQEGFPPNNYWWDLTTNAPGPNLLLANEIVQAIGRPVDYFMESGPGETTGISYAPEGLRPSILNDFQTANIAMLTWMRENWGNPDLEIWFQGATTSWWGAEPPMEVNFEGAKLLRDRQTSMALTVPGFKLGSYVPGSNKYQTYRNEMAEGLGWIHYSVEGYHAAAAEMGEAMATGLNRAENPPLWVATPAPVLSGCVADKDIYVSWPAENGAIYEVLNFRTDNGETISAKTVVAQGGRGIWSYTKAEQVLAYKGTILIGVNARVIVRQIVGDDDRGAPATIVVDQNAAPACGTDIVVPTDYGAKNLTTTRNSWGDMRLSFQPTTAAIAGDVFEVRIYDGYTLARTINLTMSDLKSGVFSVDYPIEQRLSDVLVAGNTLRWTVSKNGGQAVELSGTAALSNTSIVKKTIVVVGSSNAAGHFTSASGAGAAKNLISAGAMRRKVAADLGLSSIEVMPVNATWAGSALSVSITPGNGWWDIAASAPGPRLTEAIDIINSLDTPVDYIVWSGGEFDAASGRPTAVAGHNAALAQVISQLRAAGTGNRVVYFQTIGRRWGADSAGNAELFGPEAYAMRQQQIAMSSPASINVGSFVPGAGAVSGYATSTGNRFILSSASFHAAAVELGEAMAGGIDRAATPPVWATMEPPVVTFERSGIDMFLNWPAENGASFVVVNYRHGDSSILSTKTVTAGSDGAQWSFTEAEQIAAYGQVVALVRVSIHQAEDGVTGPNVNYTHGTSLYELWGKNLETRHTSIGDISMSFMPTEAGDISLYSIDIMNGDDIVHTISDIVSSSGRLHGDFLIEARQPAFGAMLPEAMKWRVVFGGIPGSTYDGPTYLDNSIVQRVVGIGGQSNALGHFTTLSGANLGECSAMMLRSEIAAASGLRAIEVLPLEMAWGSAAADRHADDDPVNGLNYWWDIEQNRAGPRLSEAIGKINEIGRGMSALLWAQGENDASAIHNSNSGQTTGRLSTPERYETATKAIFAALRSAAGNTNMPIYLQMIQRAFWSLDVNDTNPSEIAGEAYSQVRNKQKKIATDEAGTHVGSWVPGAEKYTGYNPDQAGGQVQWIHFSADVYHNAASEVAEAITNPLDRINDAPEWVTEVAPVLTPSLEGLGDEVVTWPGVNGHVYTVINLNVQDNSVISSKAITVSGGEGRWTFTTEEQEDEYGPGMFPVVSYVTVYRNLSGDIPGPSSTLIIRPDDLRPPAPSELVAVRLPDQTIRLTWNAISGASGYLVTNRSVMDNSPIDTYAVSVAQWDFTAAMQNAAYGSPAGAIFVEVVATAGASQSSPATIIETIPAT